MSNYFNVYSIMKLIFKKRGDEYIGRFHPDNATCALNPLTNNRINGEVAFYLVENPYLKIEPKEDRYPKGKTLPLDGIKGVFIGTDYNFTFSSKLRTTIFHNCIEENRHLYMKFQDYRSVDWRIQRLLASNGIDDDAGNGGANLNEVDNHIHEIVYNSFNESNIHMLNGLILGIYRILAVAAALISLTATF